MKVKEEGKKEYYLFLYEKSCLRLLNVLFCWHGAWREEEILAVKPEVFPAIKASLFFFFSKIITNTATMN